MIMILRAAAGGWGGVGDSRSPRRVGTSRRRPEILRDLYDEQYAVRDYREFVRGWPSSSVERDDDDDDLVVVDRPIIFGAMDDHDYGQNNGDVDYRHRREWNIAFVDFLYSGIEDDEEEEVVVVVASVRRGTTTTTTRRRTSARR